MSSIPLEYAVAIQNDIYIMTLDDYTPHGILGGLSVHSSVSRWQYTVEIIYRCLAVGYWRVWNEEWLKVRGLKGYEAFCEKLAEFNPYHLSGEGEQYWLEPFLCCTELSIGIVKRFDIRSTSSVCCRSFISEVESFFEEKNVAWRWGGKFLVKE